MADINKLIVQSFSYIKEDDAEPENLNEIEKAIVKYVITNSDFSMESCKHVASNLGMEENKVKEAVYTLLVKLIVDNYLEDNEEEMEEADVKSILPGKIIKKVAKPDNLNRLKATITGVRG